MKGPADKPGADVVWPQNDEYTLNATGSTDNEGIVLYSWEITNPDTTVTVINVTTPTTTWTPTQYGIHKIICGGFDAAGNVGYHLFMMDVVEVISGQTISNTDVSYDHSVAVTTGSLTYRNVNIDITGGSAAESATGSDAPDQLSEALENRAGKLAGHWTPYYGASRNDDYYGLVREDTTTKLSGTKSINLYGGRYYYGFEYHFDQPVDLTEYSALSFWIHSNYNSDYNYMYYCYFYANPATYSTPYTYTYQTMYQGGRVAYNGWMGYTIPLDMENTGFWYDYYMKDLSQVSIVRFYMYYLYNNYGSYQKWIDNVGFYNPSWGDEITESATPSGDKSGYWTSSYGVTTGAGTSYVGSSSVQIQLRMSYSNYIYYYFDNAQDLSSYASLRFITNLKTSGGSQVNYAYYWGSYNPLYVYDVNGRYAYFRLYSSTYFYYSYGTSYGGTWFMCNFPWGSNQTYYDSGVDWTQIKYVRWRVSLSYSYPSSTYLYSYWDGLEWYKPGAATTSNKPTNGENIPHGIYSLGSGSLTMDRVTFTGDPDYGSFVNSQANLVVKNSTFEGLWGTSHPAIKNSGTTYGGILAFGATAELYDITILGASSSGVYLENCNNIKAANLDFEGYASSFAGAAGVIVAYVDTNYGTKGTVTITDSEFHDSDQGSGIMVMSYNDRGNAQVNINNVDVYNNAGNGIVTEVAGYSGNMSVTISRCEGWGNSLAAFTLSVGKSIASPNTQVKFTVKNSIASDNVGYGVSFEAKNADCSVLAKAMNMDIHDNGRSGIQVSHNSNQGLFTAQIIDTNSYENAGHGMFINMKTSNYRDINGNSVTADGVGHIDLDNSSFHANNGHGVYELHNPSGSYNDQPKENFEMIAWNSTFARNEGNGWYVTPDGRPQYGNRYAFSEWHNCDFTDNKGDGFYLYTNYYAYYYYGTEVQEHFAFYDCTFTYNQRGIRHYTENGAYGCQTWVTVDGCTFEDNDYQTIYAYGYWYTYYDSGYTFAKSCEYHLLNTLLDGEVHLDLSGYYDYSAFDTWATVEVVNCTYTYDEPMFIRLGTYYYNYLTFDANVIYKGNTHTSPSIGDGVFFDLSAGRFLNVYVDIEDQDLYDPLGNGVNIWMHTLYQYNSAKTITGRVNMVNLDIRNPLEDGIYIHSSHALAAGGSSSGFYSLLDSRIHGVNTGIKASGFSGEIRNTVFSNVRHETIYAHYGVIDVYNSEVGPIEEDNLRVDEQGAIKLWFTLRIKVVWRDEPETPVKGTTVEIKDNSWTILGVNSIEDMEGVLFSNLNSYTVLPDGIFTKNPYIVTADYIGIVKEQHVNIKENSEVTIYMVDDVSPRVTIETPLDGTEQREPSVTVKGTSYDKHTGIDRVLVTIDGVKWIPADLSPDRFIFEHTFDDLPEGVTLIRVRAYDEAGNRVEVATSILVDSTPPTLQVITPEDGMRTNKRILEIVGVTDVGADVYINDQPIDIQYTLISHNLMLAEGPNAIKVAAVDYLGNIVQEVRYVTLDTQAPYVDIVNVEDGESVNDAKLTLDGMTEKEDVTITINGEPVDVYDGAFEATVTLVEGENDISIYAVDGVENSRTITLTVYLDRTAPWLRLTEPSSDVLTDNNFRVAGYVEQGSRVFVNEREIEVVFGYFDTTVSAPEGAYELHISAVDPAGNELVRVIPLTVDTIAPVIEVTYPMEGFVTNEDTINVMGSITGTAGEDMRFLELYINGVPQLFDYLTGGFSHEVLLDEGVNRIVFESMDTSGNTDTVTRTVMLDSKAPYLSVFIGNVRQDPNWNEPVALGDFVYVTGFTEIGAALTIDGVSVDVDSETGAFNYTLSIPKPLPGLKIYTKEITVTSSDAAGNAVTMVKKANRIEGATTTEEEKTTTAEWLILFLAVVIFGMALAGAYGYNRIQAQHEMIEAYESAPAPARMTPNGRVIAPPPARPARGGRPRPRSPVSEDEDEVIIETDEEEV